MTIRPWERGAAALAAGAALLASAVYAQTTSGYDQDQATTTGELDIYAPRVVGRSAIGAPIEVVRESRVVYTGDLDLRYSWGVRALRHRIQRAARDACDDLDARYPITEQGGPDCYKEAVRGAYNQVADRVGYWPSGY
jgi:UrcA family protein